MPKGKKKDKKKEEIPIHRLSLAESDKPSTSQEQRTDDDDVGAGGGRKKKKAQKEQPVYMDTSDSHAGGDIKVPQQSEPTKSQPELKEVDVEQQKRKETNDDDDECEGLGLGLGGPKKNRKKKKKPDSSAAVTSQAAPRGPPQAGPQAAPKPAPQPAPQAVPWAAPQAVPQPAPQAVPQPAPQAVPWAAPQAVPQPAPQSAPQAAPWAVPQGAPRPTPQSAPQAVPQAAPEAHKQRHGTSVPSEPLKPPPSTSWGQTKPVVLQSPTGEATKPRQKSAAVGQSKPETSGAPSMGYGQKPGPSRPSTGHQPPMCLFKIPDKVLGRSVPCRHLKVLANYLEMTIKPLKIYRYDVIFKPEKPKKLLPLAYSLAAKQYFNKIPVAFDQRKNIYAISAIPGVLPNERLKCEVKVMDANDKPMNFEVSLKFTGMVDLDTIITYMKTGGTSLNPPTEAIQAVDVILRQGTLESYVKAGRQFFKRPSRPIDLGDGLEMWTGLFQSAIFTSRPFVNIDVAHKGFPRSQLLIDAFTRDFRLDPTKTINEQRGRNVEAFLQFLRGLKVSAYLGGDVKKGVQREFIVNELVDPPRKMYFNLHEGTSKEYKCSVMDYFQKEKQSPVRYPNLNCVWVGPKDKRIYYPMEFLHVSYGQICNKQLNEMQLSTLVKESATPPLDRKRKIEEVIADMNYSKSEYFKKFGLDISNQFVNVDAKVLQPPRIEVGGGSVEPRRGVWQAKRLLKAQHLESWGLISVDTDPRNSFDNVINMIIRVGNEMGMDVKSPKMVAFNVRATELMRTLQMVKEKGIVMLFVIISTRGRDYYHKLKRTAEREVGVLTQCIKEFTALRKMNEQTIRNIMLKVNSKLMGINHALDARSTPVCLQQGKVMLVGADVTHPSPDQSSVPSIAAVTASIDSKFTIYNIALSVQTPKKEMIVDFEDMMVEHLNEFEKRQRDLPSKIYVFRDGVSEGQFAQVMNSELQAVHNAYKRKTGPGSNRRPEVLFLLVQKRHHTRFFLGDSTYNVEPGTVVDSHIVHPKELDFYLVSHQAIKGTARPTRYHAVCNDGRIAQDEVEQLTYYLCHLYARCTRAVSYPTPTYYAHLACMRARSLTFGDRFSNAELERSPQRLRVLERILETSKMFFV